MSAQEIAELFLTVVNFGTGMPMVDKMSDMTESMKKYVFCWNDATLIASELMQDAAAAKAKYAGPDRDVSDIAGDFSDEDDTRMTKLNVLKKRIETMRKIKF